MWYSVWRDVKQWGYKLVLNWGFQWNGCAEQSYEQLLCKKVFRSCKKRWEEHRQVRGGMDRAVQRSPPFSVLTVWQLQCPGLFSSTCSVSSYTAVHHQGTELLSTVGSLTNLILQGIFARNGSGLLKFMFPLPASSPCATITVLCQWQPEAARPRQADSSFFPPACRSCTSAWVLRERRAASRLDLLPHGCTCDTTQPPALALQTAGAPSTRLLEPGCGASTRHSSTGHSCNSPVHSLP